MRIADSGDRRPATRRTPEQSIPSATSPSRISSPMRSSPRIEWKLTCAPSRAAATAAFAAVPPPVTCSAWDRYFSGRVGMSSTAKTWSRVAMPTPSRRATRARLPGPGVLHRRPGLLGRFGAAFLEKLDRDPVRRAHEGHVAVPGRPVDGDARVHQLAAGRVNIVDAVREVTEIAPARVGLRIPVEGELDERCLGLAGPLGVAGRGEEHERIAALLVVDAANFLQAELVAVEVERLIKVRHPNHRMQIF